MCKYFENKLSDWIYWTNFLSHIVSVGKVITYSYICMLIRKIVHIIVFINYMIYACFYILQVIYVEDTISRGEKNYEKNWFVKQHWYNIVFPKIFACGMINSSLCVFMVERNISCGPYLVVKKEERKGEMKFEHGRRH